MFFGSVDRHTSQSQHREGTPVDVPDPRNRIFIDFKEKSRFLREAKFYFLNYQNFLPSKNHYINELAKSEVC